MKKTSKKALALWMYRYARPLELARWRCDFEGGSNMEVVKALQCFQNADGGFSHAVDPDNWNTNSLPYATMFALGILREVNFTDLTHPIYQGILRYLENNDPPYGWAFTVPSNKDFPHAPFFDHSEEYNKTERLGVILAFTSFILEELPRDSKLYQAILPTLPEHIQNVQKEDLGDMGLLGYISLIAAMQKAGIEGYDYAALTALLKTRVDASIQRDPAQWSSYGYRPSDYIKSPNSPFYPGNEDVVALELDFLADTLPKDGIWPVSWTWFQYNDVYKMEYPVSQLWSKTWKGIEKALFLREFGAMEE